MTIESIKKIKVVNFSIPLETSAKPRVAIAMSGGVDPSVAAKLLLDHPE